MCAPRTYTDASRARQRARRDQAMAWLRDYKRSRGCVDCGHKGHPSGCDLDIDHTSGKTFSVAHMRSPATIQAEIERHQCVVRCANCHRIKTYLEKRATMDTTRIPDEAREDFANCTTEQDDGSLALYADTLVTPELERCIAAGLVRVVNDWQSPPELTALGAALAQQMAR